MAQRRNTETKRGKDEASVASSDAASSARPMDKFKSLARRIINVPRKEYAEIERRNQEAKDRKR
jgi:hypothetical protein